MCECNKNLLWYAAGGHIMKMGPYDSQARAWKALVLTEVEQERQGSIHPKNARVWCEEKK